MKLFIEDNDGNQRELVELSEMAKDSELLIFKLGKYITAEAIDQMKKYIESATVLTGKKILIVGPEVDKVYGVNASTPPKGVDVEKLTFRNTTCPSA